MAEVDFEKLHKQQKIAGWLTVVMAGGTVFKFIQAKVQGVIPYDAIVTGSLGAVSLLGYILLAVKIEREQEAEIQRQIKLRRSKAKKQKSDDWSHVPVDPDNPYITPGGRAKERPEAKRPMLSGFPKWLAIGAATLFVLWGVMWIVVNAHRWFDSPPPPVAEWDDVELHISAVGLKMPKSTGGRIESELAPEISRVAFESEVRQHGSRAFFVLRSRPVVQFHGWPKKELLEESRRLWEEKIALESPESGGHADPVAAIPQLSANAPLYGFRTHYQARSLANYRIEGLSLCLPDGQVLELQYWTKGEDPAAEADAYFATLRPLAGFGTPARANVGVIPRAGDITRPDPPPKPPEPDWDRLSFSELQKKVSRELTSESPPPPPRELTRRLLDPLPMPAKFESFRSGDWYATSITARGYRDGWGMPVLMVIPDGLRPDPRYHTLLADFEATGFAVLVLGLANREQGGESFTGFLQESDQLDKAIDEAFTHYQHGYDKPRFVLGFGSGGHLAGMGAIGVNFGKAFASIDGGYVDFTGDAAELLRFDPTPQAIAARTFVPHLDELTAEFRLFVLDGDPQSSVQRTAAAIRASGAEFFDGRPPQFGLRRLSLIDVPSERPDDDIARVHQCLRELLTVYAKEAGKEVQRDTSPATPAIAPENALAKLDFPVEKGTGNPPYFGPDKHKEDDQPPVTLPEGPPYDKLLVSPDRRLLRSGPPPADKLPQEELLSGLEGNFRALRGRVKTETYDAERKLTGRFVRGEGVRRGEAAPALLLLHSGLTSDPRDLGAAQPFADAGFHVFCPTYRGETDPAEYPFTAFVDEAEDAATAARWLAAHEDVDPDHVYALGIGAGGHVAGLLSLRDVPLRSTASIDGVIDPETDGRGIFDVYEPGPLAHRLRSLVGNLGDMQCEHVLYFTFTAMERAYRENQEAGMAKARSLLTREAADRRRFVMWRAGVQDARNQTNRIEARAVPIGGADFEDFGSLLVDGQDRKIDREAGLAEQTMVNVRSYLRRCAADVQADGGRVGRTRP